MLLVIVFSLLLFSWENMLLSMIVVTILSIINMNSFMNYTYDMLYMISPVSSVMVVLSCALSLFCVFTTPYQKCYSYSMCLMTLLLTLVLVFSMDNLLLFYVFFECALIPTLMLIIGWGYQPERLQAGTYMMIYTVTASLPLLFVIIWWGNKLSSQSLPIIKNSGEVMSLGVIIFLIMAFLVKLPMYGLHLWLPKAHVEAPLVGSMILAGVLLKLGGYGLYLVSQSFCLSTSSILMKIVIAFSFWGAMLASLVCLLQSDMKALVAYSSVAHMGVVIVGMLSGTMWGYTSSVITMVAHGFSSSAMFCLAYFTYEKINTRSLKYCSGLLNLYPILSMLWFIYCCINMAAPPTLNLVGELMIIMPLSLKSIWLVTTMGLMVFFSAAYNMYLYSSINHGFYSHYFFSGSSMSGYELLSLFLHFIPILLLFKLNIIL
uniref:NADH-ubiquinone oxidoreductase chain 4 n=1 Tax=Odontoglaja guamensis TaxID=259595 RepID=E6Y1B6_9GAST|nr:NADH dehydrogenase subunit 4 [Odontoglaja guamensis]